MKTIHAATRRPRGSSRRAETSRCGEVSSAIAIGAQSRNSDASPSWRAGWSPSCEVDGTFCLEFRSPQNVACWEPSKIYQSSRRRQNGSLSPMLANFDDGTHRLAPKVIRLYSALIAINLLVWVWAFAAFHSYPLLLATALIAYGLGLRHAVDADHIAAIDNITRKLMQEGKRPITVGLFFSLGHSTVVFAGSLIIA